MIGDTAQIAVELKLKDSQFQSAIAKDERSLQKLNTTVGKTGGAFSAVAKNIGGFQKNMGNAFGNVSKGAGNAVKNIEKLALVAGTLAVGAIVGATRAAIDFEDAFSGIRKTVDEADLTAAGMSFEDLSDSIRKMSREMPIAATELAAIGEAAGALGIRAQDIEGFTEVVAKLAVTTDLTSDSAATALGQLGTTLHLTGSDFNEFADSLVALGNAGASTESQIVEMAARFAAAGTSAGLSKEEVLALSSAVASMGIEVEAGGTALSQTFNNITQGIGTSSAEAKAFADTLKLSAAEFKTAWDRDALGTFEDFLQELGKMDQFEQASILEKVGITGQRQLSAVKLMAQNVGFVNDQLEISRNATGALGEEAAKKFATTASQLKILKNNLTDIGITVGTELLPKITALTGKFVTFLNTPKAQQGIKDFARDLAADFETVATEVQKIDFRQIGDSLKVAADFGKGLIGAFLSAPQWLQTAVVTGWGLNKLTGGAVQNIMADLTKAVIGGAMQQFVQRGASPANPLFVSDVTGGLGGAGVAGKAGLLGTLLKGVFPAAVILGIGTAIGSAVVEAMGGQLTDPEKQSGTGRVVGNVAGVDVVMGQNYAAQVRAEDERRRRRQNQPGSPDERQARDDLHKLAQSALEEHRRGERGIERMTSIGTAVQVMHHALHADLQSAIGVIKSSSDPAAIAAAVDAAVAAVTGGAGSSGTTKGLVGDLKVQLAAAEASNNPDLAAKIKAAIAQIEPFQKGRQWQQEQLTKAQKIVDSNKTTAQKTSELKGIQQDLLSHQRTMAGGIVGGLIDVVAAVKAIKLPAGQTPVVNDQTGFVTGGKPAPKGSPTVNDQTGFVTSSIKVTTSTRDQTTAAIVRGRSGPTPAQAGAT